MESEAPNNTVARHDDVFDGHFGIRKTLVPSVNEERHTGDALRHEGVVLNVVLVNPFTDGRQIMGFHSAGETVWKVF